MSKLWKIILSAFVFLLIVFLFFYFSALAPQKSSDAILSYEVKSGTSSRNLASDLKTRGLIRSKWAFLIYLKVNGGIIKSGFYELSPSYNLGKTVFNLTSELKEWNVTFPEGYAIRDMADLLEKRNIVKKEDFLASASDIVKYKAEFPFLSEVKSQILEGYLFPDTYRLNLEISADQIIKIMLENFQKKVYKELSNKKLDETIALASIVEREAKDDEERPMIAAVYLNRLSKKMELEADPTVQYAKGSWEPITKDDYTSVDSPYNTYKYFGLPPSPISNPGLASIKAVLAPAETEALYFFHTQDGQTIFSQTAEEHVQKQKEYLK